MRISQSNYYSLDANKEYFYVSKYKDFVQCEAMAMAKISGIYKPAMTRAMLIGSFVDAYFEGTLDEFIKENPAIFTRKNELRSEFQKANEIISKMKNDELFMSFM